MAARTPSPGKGRTYVWQRLRDTGIDYNMILRERRLWLLSQDLAKSETLLGEWFMLVQELDTIVRVSSCVRCLLSLGGGGQTVGVCRWHVRPSTMSSPRFGGHRKSLATCTCAALLSVLPCFGGGCSVVRFESCQSAVIGRSI
jgi:hypothetical protein